MLIRGTHSRHGEIFVVCLWLLCICPSVVCGQNPVNKLCQEYFQQKQYPRASHCYMQLAERHRLSHTPLAKLERGGALLNAILSLRLAAKQAQSVSTRSSLYERAIQHSKTYLREKLYSTSTERIRVQTLLVKMEIDVGKANLVVTTGHLRSKLRISGAGQALQARGYFSGKVPPGQYTILYTYPGHPVKAKLVIVSPNQPLLVALQRKPRPSKQPQTQLLRVVSWVALGTGIAALVVGGGVLTWGLTATTGERDTLIARPQDTTEQTRKIQQLDQDARTQTFIGTTLIVSGIALSAAGVVGALLTQQQPQAPAPNKSTQRAQTIGTFGQ